MRRDGAHGGRRRALVCELEQQQRPEVTFVPVDVGVEVEVRLPDLAEPEDDRCHVGRQPGGIALLVHGGGAEEVLTEVGWRGGADPRRDLLDVAACLVVVHRPAR